MQPASGQTRLEVMVSGRVQGVGFRLWTRTRARELSLTGSATNLADGRVLIVAEGSRANCEALLAALTNRPPGRVTGLVKTWSDAQSSAPDFAIS